jgi:hypothetical protein
MGLLVWVAGWWVAWLRRKLIFYIPFGIGGVCDPERLPDHMEQPEQECLPPQPLQLDDPTAPAWDRQDGVMGVTGPCVP